MILKFKVVKKASLILLFMFSFTAYGQYTVKGKVVDSTGPVAYANVIFWRLGESNKNGVVTGEKGNFSFKVEKGEYKISIVYMGYAKKGLDIKVTSNKDLGEVIVHSEPEKLLEVQIVSRKEAIERRNDRLIFNVSRTTAAEAGTALDALSYTPSVILNEGQLSLLGKSKVGVLINGRISPLRGSELTNYLNSIPSSNIKRLEVITTPPAKYSAEGNGGLINIVLKKTKK